MADTTPPAFPVAPATTVTGLTKREWFAGLILHALIVHGGLPRDFHADQANDNIRKLADAVIARLAL